MFINMFLFVKNSRKHIGMVNMYFFLEEFHTNRS